MFRTFSLFKSKQTNIIDSKTEQDRKNFIESQKLARHEFAANQQVEQDRFTADQKTALAQLLADQDAAKHQYIADQQSALLDQEILTIGSNHPSNIIDSKTEQDLKDFIESQKLAFNQFRKEQNVKLSQFIIDQDVALDERFPKTQTTISNRSSTKPANVIDSKTQQTIKDLIRNKPVALDQLSSIPGFVSNAVGAFTEQCKILYSLSIPNSNELKTQQLLEEVQEKLNELINTFINQLADSLQKMIGQYNANEDIDKIVEIVQCLSKAKLKINTAQSQTSSSSSKPTFQTLLQLFLEGFDKFEPTLQAIADTLANTTDKANPINLRIVTLKNEQKTNVNNLFIVESQNTLSNSSLEEIETGVILNTLANTRDQRNMIDFYAASRKLRDWSIIKTKLELIEIARNNQDSLDQRYLMRHRSEPWSTTQPVIPTSSNNQQSQQPSALPPRIGKR